jgi:pimeloyl-ACP methyl ester carboxylesterase
MPYASRAGVRLHYADRGSGPAVLLHTGGGGDGRMWDRAGYSTALASYRNLSVDHRGHGRSDCPPGLSAHALDEYVDDVIAVLDAAGVDQSALVGYSAGGRIAIAVARKYPDRVTAVVRLGAVGARDEESAEYVDYAKEVRARGMRGAMEQIAATEAEPPPSWLLDNLSATEAEMFALYLEAEANAASEWADYPHVQSPTLLICGQDEEPEASAHIQLAADTLPVGSAVVLPGLSHLQAFWRTDLVLPPLTDFLRRHLGGG